MPANSPKTEHKISLKASHFFACMSKANQNDSLEKLQNHKEASLFNVKQNDITSSCDDVEA